MGMMEVILKEQQAPNEERDQDKQEEMMIDQLNQVMVDFHPEPNSLDKFSRDKL